jgi:ubiquitin carboxyl-terminal hydrolase 10
MRLGLSSAYGDMLGKAPKPIKISGYFMDVLSEFQKMRGEQEDALEFLEFFLDNLHSEYEKSGLELPPSCEKQTKRSTDSAPSASGHHESGTSEGAWGDFDDGWAEVGKRGKSSVLRQNPVDTTRSPINWLFKGSLRSELKQSGKKQSSITIEPFHCLHLNLELEQQETNAVVGATVGAPAKPLKTYTMDEMIRKAFEVEEIQGVDPGSSMKRFVSMESLPVVLTLNIKRFTYHPEIGPVKLPQFVKYPAYFEFPTQFLSSTCRAENAGSNGESGGFPYPPRYELFAVVSHLGKFVAGGHYTCVCRDNKDQWFRYNDEHVLSISEAAALSETAYLLFYIRTNRPPPKATQPAPVNVSSTAQSKGVPGSGSAGKPTAGGNPWQQPLHKPHHHTAAGGGSNGTQHATIPGMSPTKAAGPSGGTRKAHKKKP